MLKKQASMNIKETPDMEPDTRYLVRVRSVGTLATAGDSCSANSMRIVGKSDWVFADRPFRTPKNGLLPSQLQAHKEGYESRAKRMRDEQRAEARADGARAEAQQAANSVDDSNILWNCSL